VNENLKRTSKAVLLCVFAVIALSLGGLYAVSGQNEDEGASIDSEGRGFFAMMQRGMPFGRMMGSLTEEQRNEIQDMIAFKLEEWGIEPPEPLLTEEERDELRTGIEELRELDATPEEIKEYIAGKLEAWGVELPERPIRQVLFQGKGAAFQGKRGYLRGFGNNDTA
jgi:hypothetical protein